jgi:Peptidase M15
LPVQPGGPGNGFLCSGSHREPQLGRTYRCPALNKIVGGATNSAHLYGCFADLQWPEWQLSDVVQLAVECLHVRERLSPAKSGAVGPSVGIDPWRLRAGWAMSARIARWMFRGFRLLGRVRLRRSLRALHVRRPLRAVYGSACPHAMRRRSINRRSAGLRASESAVRRCTRAISGFPLRSASSPNAAE